MSGQRGLAALLLVFFAALLLMGGPASATPNDVIVDYRADGAIDGDHSADDLLDALTRWNQTGAANYGDFDAVVSAELDRITLGVAGGDPPSRPPSGQQQSNEIIPSASLKPTAVGPLPSPPPSSATSQPPLVFIGLTVLAGLLLLAGLATAVARRIDFDRN